MANQQDELQTLLSQAEESIKQSQEHQQREALFAQQANERFAKNLSAFEKFYPDIAQAISQFQTREDFCLHVTKSGHGNFVPQGEKVPLYSEDPIAQTIAQVDKYTQKANFGRTDYTGASPWESDDSRLHIQFMRRLSEALSRIDTQQNKPLRSLPPHYPTALIFGIGLGYHIPELMSRHSFDYMFICEPDLELFFASLFCIDWHDIITKVDEQGGCLFLSLGVDYDEFFDEIYRIANEIGSFSAINSFCYQHYPSVKVNELIKSFFDNYYQLQQGYGFYNDAITGLAHAVLNVESGANFLFATEQAKKLVSDTPVFIVGNGPSLDEAIDLIRENQNKAIIIAAGTALQSLLKAGITPDFHVLVERPKITYDIAKVIEPEQGYGDLNLLTVDVMYPDVLGLYKWSGIGLKGPEAATVFLSLFSYINYGMSITELIASSPFVSNTALSFAAMMGFKDIYMLGIDNGYHLSGQTHSKLSIYEEKDKPMEVLEGANIRLAGNFDHDVMATSLMAMSKASFDRLLTALGDKVHAYNVGNGAKLRGATAIRESDVILTSKIDDKETLVENIKTTFFKPVDFGDIEQLMSFDEFDELCDYIIDFGTRPITTRDEANAALKAQQRVIYAFKQSKAPHLFQMLKGTLLYFHCPMICFLYQFEDEQETLKHFHEVHSLWLEFVKDAKEDFRKNWRTKCTWTKPQYENYKKDS
ncbi:6-hydroxymethylpterin diphosphokinase MptE-like protein [Pseudoalteromonas sp. SSDWG2]|uniref:motility associated factor glycosyltransferase family protein n=1 Tax=Pseudoalteromonas sp. SSDWG2 TaxID=3139391 RepID=UPI003BAC2416